MLAAYRRTSHVLSPLSLEETWNSEKEENVHCEHED
jgi:hypothetical protein